ncbi:MAG: hypothetical protein R6X20_06840 [Phycisphaerae bacterium]
MADVCQLVLAVEMLLLPVWVGAVGVSPPTGLGRRLVLAPVPVVPAAAVMIVLAAVGGDVEGPAILRTQTVAVGFALLLGGLAAFLDRLAGPRAGQFLTAVLGWGLLAGVILAGPLVGMLADPLKTALVRAAVHGNPLVVAEETLGLPWLRQGLTYRWTGLGESYRYLFGHLAWWKTFLGHVFVGSGLAVFSLRRNR